MKRAWLPTHRLGFDRGVWINVHYLTPSLVESVDGTRFHVSESSLIKPIVKRTKVRIR